MCSKPPVAAPAGRLVEGAGLPKMWRLGPRACLSHAGLSQDSRALLLAAQQAALDHEQRFGEGEMALGEVVEAVAGKQQEATMQGTKRPYGASLLVTGMVPNTDASSSGSLRFVPRIYRTDPSGAYSLWKACALGQVGGWEAWVGSPERACVCVADARLDPPVHKQQGADKAMAVLEDKWRPGMSTREALALAAQCCHALAAAAPASKEGKAGKEKDSEKEAEKGAATTAAPAGGGASVDVAIVSARGTRLWDLTPLDAIEGLAQD